MHTRPWVCYPVLKKGKGGAQICQISSYCYYNENYKLVALNNTNSLNLLLFHKSEVQPGSYQAKIKGKAGLPSFLKAVGVICFLVTHSVQQPPEFFGSLPPSIILTGSNAHSNLQVPFMFWVLAIIFSPTPKLTYYLILSIPLRISP
jgi:hypothetical protein